MSRFSQHREWWQYKQNGACAIPAWGWDDTSDDEIAVIEQINLRGVISGDSLGLTSDAMPAINQVPGTSPPRDWNGVEPWGRYCLRTGKGRAAARQQFDWEQQERERRIEQQRQADIEWGEAEAIKAAGIKAKAEAEYYFTKRREKDPRWNFFKVLDFRAHSLVEEQQRLDADFADINAFARRLNWERAMWGQTLEQRHWSKLSLNYRSAWAAAITNKLKLLAVEANDRSTESVPGVGC